MDISRFSDNAILNKKDANPFLDKSDIQRHPKSPQNSIANKSRIGLSALQDG
jgi:hypothetical protein